MPGTVQFTKFIHICSDICIHLSSIFMNITYKSILKTAQQLEIFISRAKKNGDFDFAESFSPTVLTSVTGVEEIRNPSLDLIKEDGIFLQISS